MGNRVHVAKAYKVEYADTAAFNWKHQEFFDLLQTIGAEPSWMNGDNECPDWNFECPKENYHNAVEFLRVYINNPDAMDVDTKESIYDALESLDEEPAKVLQLMEEFERLAATDDGYIHFAAF